MLNPAPTTFTEAIELAVTLAGEDFIYVPVTRPDWPEGPGTCVYRDRTTGEPSCLIGQALDLLGLLPDLDTLVRHSSNSGTGITSLATRYPAIGNAMTAAELEGAAQAQDRQDRKYPWGTALAEYLDTIAHYDADSEFTPPVHQLIHPHPFTI